MTTINKIYNKRVSDINKIYNISKSSIDKMYGFNVESSTPPISPHWTVQSLEGSDSPRSNIYEYGSSVFVGTENTARLLRWSSGGAWTMVADTYNPPGFNPYISSLIVYGGNLYGMMCDSAYLGRLLVWNGSNSWNLSASEPATDISGLIIFNGSLYGFGYRLCIWNNVNAWNILTLSNLETRSCCVYNNLLYGMMNTFIPGTGYQNRMHVFDNVNTWTMLSVSSEPTIYSMIVYNSKLYGSGTGGQLYRWNDSNAWVQVAPALSGATIYIVEHNGSIYGGSLGNNGVNGQLWKFNGTNAWSLELEKYQGAFQDAGVSSIIERSTSGTIFALMRGSGIYDGSLMEAVGV